MLRQFELVFENSKTSLALNSARQVHGLFFRLLESYDASLSAAVHSAQDKPFALWLTCRSGRIGATLSTFSKTLSEAVEVLAATTPRQVMLEQEVTLTILPSRKDSWVELWSEANVAMGVQRLSVQFLTPTSFRRAGVQVLFPEPALLFHNVYGKALIYGDEFLAANLAPPEEYIGNLYVSRYELKTKEVNYGKYKIIGCTGYSVYDCRRIVKPYQRQSLAFLAALGQYTGIGYKTTMGLGRVSSRLDS